MKRPSIKLDKDAILDFFLRHVEKIAVAAITVLACGMVWGGINAVRTMPAGPGQLPKAITDASNRAVSHIQSAKQPPADAIKNSELTKLIDPWRSPEIAGPPPLPLWNKPLFEERTKRTGPEVFPIEDLRAVAGVALFPAKDGPAGEAAGNPADVEPATKQKRPKRGGRAGNQQPALDAAVPPGFGPEFGGQAAPPGGGPQAAAVRGRLVPYCIVTGLIPVAKQAGDYRERYEGATYRDPKRDEPLWSDYLVERSVVVPGGRDNWEKIDMRVVAKQAQKDWAGVQAEQLPPGFLLSADKNPGAGATAYAAPLPQLVGDAWGTESMHPWFVEQARKAIAEQAAAAKRSQDQTEPPVAPENPLAGPGFESPLDAPQPGQPMAPMQQPGGFGIRLDAAGRPIADLDYRLFRFVDTTVEIGKAYRYRVRLSLWNPNYKLPTQYLAEAALAKDAKLPSQPSNVTEPVRVPGTTSLAVRPLQKADMKKFKPGMMEVLVLAEDSATQSYTLRSLVTEIGGFANIDKRLNRPAETRVRGADIDTNSVLVDMRGRQENRGEARAAKPTPPEPLEMLFLREDGSFEMASAADSQLLVDRYIGTLPAMQEQKPDRDEPEQPAANPFGNPFQR
jgi:hypothetical protein